MLKVGWLVQAEHELCDFGGISGDYTYIYTLIHIHTYTYVYIYTLIHIHTSTLIHTYALTHIH